MNVTVNGRARELPDGATVAAALALLSGQPDRAAHPANRSITRRVSSRKPGSIR